VAASITIAPIVEGMVEEWRAFVGQLQGPRRIDWAQSQRRRGITRQVVTLAAGEAALAVVFTEAVDIEQAASRLAESDDPFDSWFRQQMSRLHRDPYDAEVVFDSAPRPGPWRGWR